MRLRWAFAAVLLALGLLLWWWRDAAVAPPVAEQGPAPKARPSAPSSHRRLGPRSAPVSGAPGRKARIVKELDEIPEDLSAYFRPACAVQGAAGVSEAILFPSDRPTVNGVAVAGPVYLQGGQLWLPRTISDGSGVLAIEGFAPTSIRWDDKGCSPSPIVLQPPNATVSGVVRNAEGEPAGRVFVEGCGGRAMTDFDGGYSMELLPGECSLRAFRQDGYFMARSEPKPLRVRDGDDLIVDLDLPRTPRGGVGMRVDMHDEGIGVFSVVPGSPAEQAGVQSGDIVIAVNGGPAVDLSLEEFIEQVTGDAGTTVELTVVGASGEERQLKLLRTPMGPD